nr:FAD binding domain-containing protein [uncultured Anaerostipes sp.]
MLKIKEYVRAESLAQAYELNQKKSTCILGGMLWLKMSNRTFQKAVDLSGLGLDQIEETEEAFSIGAMVTLRQLEQHQKFNEFCQGIAAESVKSIVGVQFRNMATVGGSIFGRFGFSDVLTCFLALDTYVELYHGGIIPLEEFAKQPYDRDILVRLIVKKMNAQCVYLTHRNTKTDFPVLTCAVSSLDGKGYAVIGARPGRAVRIKLPSNWEQEEDCQELAVRTAQQTTYGSNMRASAAYRKHLAEVLLVRSMEKLAQERRGR